MLGPEKSAYEVYDFSKQGEFLANLAENINRSSQHYYSIGQS
jgi:hypothetical protein